MHIKQTYTYHVYDNVNGEAQYFHNFADLQSYADIWCERLNGENEYSGETFRYSTVTLKDVEDVFEVCNIEIEII